MRHLARPVMRRYWYFWEAHCQNAVFVHINKTAGTSIKRALGLRPGHRTALEIRDELGEACWERKFTFAFVRNPWDRVVSQYHWRKRSDQTDLKTSPIPFRTWVSEVFRDRSPRYYDDPKMFMPQLDWISDPAGKVLVDFVGRFEKLPEDFRIVCDLVDVRVRLPHLNKADRRAYREYFDRQSARVVEDWYRKDVEHFHYSF